MASRRHRGALLMSFSPSLSLYLAHSFAAHIALVLCKPFHCRHQAPLHPHFHLYPIFHFISMVIWGDKKIPCYVIYSDAAGLSMHTRGKPVGLALGHGLRSIKTASVESKAGYVDGRTVWHTGDKDVYYEFSIIECSVLS